MSTTHVRLSVCLLAAAALFAGTVPAAADGSAPTKRQALFEVRFLTGMIDHHHMAVMMAELCETRAIHEELLAMCAEIKTAQMAEIEMMQGWLQDWYGIAYEPQMKPGHEKMMARMAEMEGAEFEIAFLKMMIRHHWGAIVEARRCLRMAYHEELHHLCAEIIETQSAEIEIMQEWLCDWYGICNYGPKP